MSKFFQAFLTGVFFTFILDFFLFLGIQQNYIKLYDINVYYNILFADNQNIYIYLFFTIFIGYLIIYLNNSKISVTILSIMFFLVVLTLFKDVGTEVAKMLLMKKDVTIKWKKYTYRGDIYYNGRKNISFYDYKLKRIILLNKQEIKK